MSRTLAPPTIGVQLVTRVFMIEILKSRTWILSLAKGAKMLLPRMENETWVSAGLEFDFDHIGLELAVSLSHLLRSTLGTKDFFLANAVRCLGSATLDTVADIKSL